MNKDELDSLVKYSLNKINLYVKKKLREIDTYHNNYMINHPLFVRYSLVKSLPKKMKKSLYMIKIMALHQDGVLTVDVYGYMEFLRKVSLCDDTWVGRDLVSEHTYSVILESLTP